MKKVTCTICLTSLLFATGCATMVNGRYQTVRITSNPLGAKVTVDRMNDQNMITPGEIALLRNQSVNLTARLNGYHPAQLELKSQLSNWVFGNAVILEYGVIGAAWDIGTGAAFELKPPRVHFELMRKSGRF